MSDVVARLIADLSRPEAFPDPVGDVEIHQTHISVVFLAGNFAYKIKKPVSLGFLDFSTLERRRHFCDEEVRLNRRLASDVYLGVVPVARTESGAAFEASGEVVEWAVKMVRLAPEFDLDHHLRHGRLDADLVRTLARRIADFHRGASRGDRISRRARFSAIEDNALANFEATRRHVGETVSPVVFARLEERTRWILAESRPLIERRAADGKPCDTHGDLRLDHVYWFPDRPPPDDWRILDCIEFNEEFRFADPIADMAFLTMDLAFAGRWDLARRFAAAYLEAADDADGAGLLPFYASYRAAVRGKVEGIVLEESEIPPDARAVALQRARAHWLAALAWAEPIERRPMLVLIGGLPGSGKSTLARSLLADGFTVVRSDVVRKELAGVESAAAPFGKGLYTREWDDRTYAELARRSAEILWTGGRAIIDASFRIDARRRSFIELARTWGVPVVFLECHASPDVVRARLAARHGDASDADWHVYEAASNQWEPLSSDVALVAMRLDTVGGIEVVAESAREAIKLVIGGDSKT